MLSLANKILGKTKKFVSNECVTEDALSFAPPQEAAEDAEEDARNVNSVRDFTKEECALDRNLHNILDDCISGTKRY